MLATTAVGAVWSSCATDIGPAAAADRLGQIEPKVLFAVDGYRYKNRVFDCIPNAAAVVASIPSIERVVVAHYAGDPTADLSSIRGAVRWDEFIADEAGGEVTFEQVPFDHPAVVMFSSGTTGKPKCLVQSGGGILINQLKELVLHADLTRDDTIFYVTTASWMMWNWLISALGTGATVVLYDGNPAFPDLGALWRLIADLKVTVFGTSASYLSLLKAQGMVPEARLRPVVPARDLPDRLGALPGWVRLRLRRHQGRSALQLALRRHRHQRVLCHREPRPTRVRGPTPGPGPGDEDRVLRRSRQAGARPGRRTGM